MASLAPVNPINITTEILWCISFVSLRIQAICLSVSSTGISDWLRAHVDESLSRPKRADSTFQDPVADRYRFENCKLISLIYHPLFLLAPPEEPCCSCSCCSCCSIDGKLKCFQSSISSMIHFNRSRILSTAYVPRINLNGGYEQCPSSQTRCAALTALAGCLSPSQRSIRFACAAGAVGVS